MYELNFDKRSRMLQSTYVVETGLHDFSIFI